MWVPRAEGMKQGSLVGAEELEESAPDGPNGVVGTFLEGVSQKGPALGGRSEALMDAHSEACTTGVAHVGDREELEVQAAVVEAA